MKNRVLCSEFHPNIRGMFPLRFNSYMMASPWLKTLEAEIKYRVQKEQEAFERQGSLLLGVVSPSFLVESVSEQTNNQFSGISVSTFSLSRCGS